MHISNTSVTSIWAYSTFEDSFEFGLYVRNLVIVEKVDLDAVPLLGAPDTPGAVEPQLDVVHLAVHLQGLLVIT